MPNNTNPLVECWNCHKFVSESAIREEDGYCPVCEQPIDLDDEGCSND